MSNYVWLNLCLLVCLVITSLFNMTMTVFPMSKAHSEHLNKLSLFAFKCANEQR